MYKVQKRPFHYSHLLSCAIQFAPVPVTSPLRNRFLHRININVAEILLPIVDSPSCFFTFTCIFATFDTCVAKLSGYYITR